MAKGWVYNAPFFNMSDEELVAAALRPMRVSRELVFTITGRQKGPVYTMIEYEFHHHMGTSDGPKVSVLPHQTAE